MHKLIVVTLALTLMAAAQENAPVTAAKTEDKPLTSFPYTPGLDVTAMDRAADPCVDFYQYSCGGWRKNNPIPPDRAFMESWRKTISNSCGGSSINWRSKRQGGTPISKKSATFSGLAWTKQPSTSSARRR